MFAAAAGVVFLAYGLLGRFRGTESENVLHVALGAAGLVLARSPGGARSFLRVGGAVSLALWVLGVTGALDWLPADVGDNWAHFALGAVLLAASGLADRLDRGAHALVGG